jgi:cystathionine gamma-synthase
MKPHKHKPETEAVRGGTDLGKKNGPLATPIFQTSTFEVVDNEEQLRVSDTDHFYTRYGNPTNTVAEAAIAELEGTDRALLFASGMNAISTTALALLKAGDHVVAQRDIYGGVSKFYTMWLPKYGVETTLVDSTDYAQHERAIQPNTRLLHLESPTNPTLQVIDLKRVAAIAKQHGIVSLIDSTFATPINQRPAEFGIDLVMHSGTKFFGGHSDLSAGVVSGRRDLMEKIWQTRTTLGGCMDPHAAWLLLRGIKTLAVRVQRQNESAMKIAQYLQNHAKVRKVFYPFLEGHAGRAVAMEQMSGGGGVLSFEIDGTAEDARRVSEALNLFTLAPSLGGVDSLICIPVLTSHAMISADQRAKMGITDQLVRLSVGVENVDDLIADLEHALATIAAPVGVGHRSA